MGKKEEFTICHVAGQKTYSSKTGEQADCILEWKLGVGSGFEMNIVMVSLFTRNYKNGPSH